jgi:PAS domain S-box-containing protein
VVLDGVVHWVSARGRTYLDANDKPVRFSGVLADITDQKRVEERLLIAQTAGGVGSFEYLSGYGTADVSEQFCRLLGLQRATSLPVRTINAVVHPDDPSIIQGMDGQHPFGPTFYEFRIQRADDGQERWLASRGEYQPSNAGGVSFIGVVYDITTTKRSEEQLRLLTETLEVRVAARTEERDRVWNLSRDLLHVIGPDGLYRAANPAWQSLLGYDPKPNSWARRPAVSSIPTTRLAMERFVTSVARRADGRLRLSHAGQGRLLSLDQLDGGARRTTRSTASAATSRSARRWKTSCARARKWKPSVS